MIYAEYKSKRDEIINRYNTMDPFSTDALLRSFIIFSANLGNFMPQCALADHLSLFRRLCIHQRLSQLDQQNTRFLKQAATPGWESSFIDHIKREPGIIATFHTGSYRIINQLLAKASLPFTLLVSSEVMEREGDAFRQVFQRIKGNGGQSADFQLVDAENPRAMFALIRAAKEGRNLVIYQDGNTGSGNRQPGEHQLCIDFFQDRLWARKGVSMLSFLLKRPIYPVLNRRLEDNMLQFIIGDPLRPGEGERREAYVKRATRQLYRHLEDLLKDDPVQWECWLYLHLYRAMKGQPAGEDNGGKPRLEGAERWGMFSIKESRFLLDKRTYNTYEVPEREYIHVYNEVLAAYSGRDR